MPAKLRDIKRVLRDYGVHCKSGGKHDHLCREGDRDYPLPHKDELHNGYVKALCRHFGIDSSEFWLKLRS